MQYPARFCAITRNMKSNPDCDMPVNKTCVKLRVDLAQLYLRMQHLGGDAARNDCEVPLKCTRSTAFIHSRTTTKPECQNPRPSFILPAAVQKTSMTLCCSLLYRHHLLPSPAHLSLVHCTAMLGALGDCLGRFGSHLRFQAPWSLIQIVGPTFSLTPSAYCPVCPCRPHVQRAVARL